MKERMKKYIVILTYSIVMAMVGVVLTACGSNNKGRDNQSEQNPGIGKDSQQVTLVFWSIATEDDSFHNAYQAAIENYEKTHTNVKIQHETFAAEEYKVKIRDAASNNELPDIFFSWGSSFSIPFVESERVMELDAYYNDKIRDELPEINLNNAIYEGRLYGVTYTTPVSVLFYNKRMFEKNNLLPPDTWEDWIHICETFKNNDVKPLGVSVRDVWPFAMYADALILKSAGMEKTYKTLTKQEGGFNDSEFYQAITKLKEFIDMEAFIEGARDLTSEEVDALFYNETIPMLVTGSWLAGSIVTDAENPEHFAATTIPTIDSRSAKETDFIGGAVDMLMVSENTKYPDVAGSAVFELGRSISKYAYLDGVGVPAWKINYDDNDVNPITKQITDYTANATSFTLWFDTLMDMEDAGKYLSLLERLYDGDVTPKEFVESMAEQLER